MAEEIKIPYPPAESFENRTAGEQILNQGNVTHILDHIEYTKNKGINVYIKDAKFPKKGWPYPEAIWAINVAKSLFVEPIKVLLAPQLRGIALGLLLPFKSKLNLVERALQTYCNLSLNVISPHIIKYDYLAPCSKEMEAVVYTFLVKLGISESPATNFAKIICTIVEYDDAYRYRIQDIMAETNKEKLMINPKKELNRLLDILVARDHSEKVKANLKNIRRLINLVFLSRKVKKAFCATVMEMDIVSLQPDEADSYWMNFREDYDYFGVPFKERKDVVLLKGYLINV